MSGRNLNDQSSFTLEYAAPADDLKELVSSYYLFRSEVEESDETERAERAQVRFLLRGGGGYRFCDGTWMDSSPITILGPTTGPTVGHIEGPLAIFGAGLQPAGWGVLMGDDASRLTNRLIDATQIFGNGLLAVRDALIDAQSFAEMVEIGNAFARTLLQRADPAPFWFTRTVDAWLTDDPSPSLEGLIEATGLSQRQLERMTKRFYGVPPKMLARKYRALRAAVALVRNEGEEVGDGFYDQSHLIREIKAFTGVTPGQMRDAPPALIRAVAEHRRKLEGQVGPLVWNA